MRLFSLVLLTLINFNCSAEEVVSKTELETAQQTIQSLKVQTSKLSKQLRELENTRDKLINSIEEHLKYQIDVQSSTEAMLDATRTSIKDQPSLKVHLFQPTNLYIFALPIVTIFIVIGGTYLSIKTLKIKSKESLDALVDSNKNQLHISELNNASEHKKSQDAIISNSRQHWINTLRDEISSLVSHQTQYSASTNERKNEIFSKIWMELFRIELMLNPKESLHNQLLEELNKGFALCTESNNVDHYKVQRAVIMNVSKKILKEEWERVKSFD